MHKRARLLIGIGFFLFVVVLVLFYLAYDLATRSFPETEGEIAVEGLSRPVQIFRDSFGVPHVYAESDQDAWFAAGFVQAQDRLWQMELIRRAGLGTLSEVLGPPALKTDKLFRTLGLRRLAEENAQALDDETRAALTAYADGVNASMDQQRGRYAVEFDMLGFEPRPWKIEHSLLLAKLMAWELNTSRWVDITYGFIVERVGEQRARDLYPDWPDNAPVTVPAEFHQKPVAHLGLPLLEADESFRRMLGLSGFGTGSNAWVVSPEKSMTGRAVLANDPHLVLTTPARWYEMRLSAPGFDVMGVSLPGIPFIVIGRNRDIAWGITSAMVDDVDYYVEEVDSVEHPMHYKLNEAWHPIIQTVDTIFVKDDLPVVLTSYRTHRGPIVNRMEPAAQYADHLISMRWVAGEVSHEARAIMNINRASDWAEFRRALRDFSAPSQNFLYADIRGNIGYILSAKIPRRPHDGFASPYPGWTDRYDWTGFIPFDRNPSALNPPQGFIVSANNRIVENDHQYYISNNWEPPWRAERIVELLSRHERLTLEDHQRIQLDLFSPQARTLVPHILLAYRGIEPEREDIKTALNYFRNWNYVMREEDVSTTLFESFLLRIMHNTFADELGPAVSSLYDTLGSKPLVAITGLFEQDSSAWFDDIRTEPVETKNMMIRKSLGEALEGLQLRFGGELKEWRWGDIHQVEFRHVFGQNSLLRGQFNVGPFPVGGSHSTVWKGDFWIRDPFGNHLGPSARMIFDLTDVNNTRTVVPPGQSGHVYHRDYDNQAALWRNGAYKVEPMDRVSLENMETTLLILRPAE